MIFFLGCDVAKTKIDVSLIDDNGQELWADKVPNKDMAIAMLLLTIVGNYPGDELVCVAESTGTYHLTLAETAHAVGIGCRVYNPILTKQGIKGTVRGKKTDRADATIIARLGLRGEGRLYTPEPYMSTKYHARSCQKLSVLNTSFKHHSDHMAHMLEEDLSLAAKEMMQGIQTAITAARKQLYKDLAASANGESFRLLQTIPGIGPYIAASIIGEVQDIRRFKTAHALTAYAGLDPKIKQSGKVLNSTGRLTKRGSSYLRRNIFIAAGAARRYDPNMKALYNKKRGEGKGYTVATVVVARKLLTIVRAVWLSEQNYDPSFVNTNS
jgi:transposase